MPADAAALARKHGLDLIVQFGSTVTGRAHERSDVDVAVLSAARDIPLERQIDIACDLQELFPGREVDLAILDHADPLFLKKVLESCVLLAGSPRRLAELRMLAFRRYQDHRRYLALERAYVARALGSNGR